MLRQLGFTLIELVTVILIIGVLSVVVGKITFQGLQSFNVSQNTAEVDWQGYIALERMANDIHQIRSAASMTTIDTSQFTFIDYDGTTVQYTMSGNTVLRNSQTLASGIDSLTFAYLNENGVVTSTPSAVRYVGITLNLSQSNITTTLSTLVGTRGMS